MATYTTNYGLHQWEASDDFLRTDFNTDFAKIDAALGEKADGPKSTRPWGRRRTVRTWRRSKIWRRVSAGW